MKGHLEDYNRRRLVAAAERKESLKKNKLAAAIHLKMAPLRSEDGRRLTGRTEMEEVYKEFCASLFVSRVDVPAPQNHPARQQTLTVLMSEEVRTK